MNKRQDRITIEALQYYVPIFEQADIASDILFDKFEELTHEEICQLESIASLKDLVVDKIYSLSGPLITRELHKILKNSPLKNTEGIFDIIYYAGREGLKKGLKKFSVDKINTSSTNYLFQWITVYAKKELTKLEAPMGIPVSRYEKYKKISAVRKKMTDLYGNEPTNQEVLDYFHSGKADIANMNGRLKNKGNISKANQKITLQDIEEQLSFETYLMNVPTYDPNDNYTSNLIMVDDTQKFFSETFIGLFVENNKELLTDKAITVIESEYAYKMSSKNEKILENMSQKEYKSLLNAWMVLFKDKSGMFCDFIIENRAMNPIFADTYIKNLELLEEVDKIKYNILLKENQ